MIDPRCFEPVTKGVRLYPVCTLVGSVPKPRYLLRCIRLRSQPPDSILDPDTNPYNHLPEKVY